jgi:hypothetical protein
VSVTFCVSGDQRPGWPELNVANLNGFALLDWLGLPTVYAGEVLAADVLTAIALRQGDESLMTAPDRELSPRVWVGGRTRAQVERYVSVLTEIAETADRHGRTVLWG